MGSQKGIKQTSIGGETGGVEGGDGDGDEESTLQQRKTDSCNKLTKWCVFERESVHVHVHVRV